MKIKIVDELMVPLSEYAVVNENESLKTAIQVLYECQKEPSCSTYKHKAVLVSNDKKKIIGKVGPLDVLKALEPKYGQIGQLSTMSLSRFGLDTEFLNSMMGHYNLWDKDCGSLAKTASKLKVKKIMYSPGEGEYVKESAPVSEAIHQFILGHHQSLLVLRKDDVVGILRLADIYKFICDLMIEE